MLKKIAILHAFLLFGNVLSDHDSSSYDSGDVWVDDNVDDIGDNDDCSYPSIECLKNMSSAPMYCARPCIDEHHESLWTDRNVWIGHCLDGGRVQKDECTQVTFGSVETFGYADITESFVGCNLFACNNLCYGVTNATAYTVQNGTICFPERSENNDMFMMEDVAKVGAISRGCDGAHKVGEMWMVGETNTTCDESYNAWGVWFDAPIHRDLFTLILTVGVLATVTILFFIIAYWKKIDWNCEETGPQSINWKK